MTPKQAARIVSKPTPTWLLKWEGARLNPVWRRHRNIRKRARQVLRNVPGNPRNRHLELKASRHLEKLMLRLVGERGIVGAIQAILSLEPVRR